MMPPEPWGEHEAAGIYRGTRWCGGAAACGARAVGDRIVSRRIHGHDVGGGLDRGHGPVGRFVRRSGADRERHDHRAGATGSRPRVQAGDFEGLPRLVIGLFFCSLTAFVMARTRSIKNCVAELSDRFFNVIIATLCWVWGKATGRTLNDGFGRCSSTQKRGTIAR